MTPSLHPTTIRPGASVRHTLTDVWGVVERTADHYSEFDGDIGGPWAYVAFDDGFACWTVTADLTLITDADFS